MKSQNRCGISYANAVRYISVDNNALIEIKRFDN